MIEVLAARGAWCRPGERVLWCWPLAKEPSKLPYILYRVSGLDAAGARKSIGSGLGKGLKSAGAFAGVAAFETVFGMGDDASTSVPHLPYAVVSGSESDCIAAARLSEWQATNQNKDDSRNPVWILTDQRLGLLEFPTEDKPSSGVLGAVRGMLSSSQGSCELPEPKVWAEFARNEITGMEQTRYQLKKRTVVGIRVSMQDGSTIDLCDKQGDRYLDRLLNMAHGRE